MAGLRTDLLLPYLLLRFSITAKVLSFCLDFGFVRRSIAARLLALRAAAGLLLSPLEVFSQGRAQTRNPRCLLVGLARSDHGTVGQLLARRSPRGASELPPHACASSALMARIGAFSRMARTKPTWATAAGQQ
jgi:hypothetical protein